MAAKKKKKGRGKNRSKGPCRAGHVKTEMACTKCKGRCCSACKFTGLHRNQK